MDLSILKNKNSLIVSILLSLISFFLPWIGITFINLSGFDILTMSNKINGVYDATSIYILLELVLFVGALFSMKKIIQKVLVVLAFLFLLLTFYYTTDTPFVTIKVGIIITLLGNTISLIIAFQKSSSNKIINS